MKQRRHGQGSQTILGLDSLMDVITNIIGALFFVIIYAVLTSFDLHGKINTPIVVISDTTPVVAECRNNTIFFPEDEKMLRETINFFKKLVDKKVNDWGKVAKELNKINIKNNYYYLRMEMTQEKDRIMPVIILQPIKEARGEDELEITNKTSAFQEALNRLSPQKQHIFFYVREDSISIFHLARKLAMEKGYKVGWEPFKLDQFLSVGGEGSLPGFDPREVNR